MSEKQEEIKSKFECNEILDNLNKVKDKLYASFESLKFENRLLDDAKHQLMVSLDDCSNDLPKIPVRNNLFNKIKLGFKLIKYMPNMEIISKAYEILNEELPLQNNCIDSDHNYYFTCRASHSMTKESKDIDENVNGIIPMPKSIVSIFEVIAFMSGTKVNKKSNSEIENSGTLFVTQNNIIYRSSNMDSLIAFSDLLRVRVYSKLMCLQCKNDDNIKFYYLDDETNEQLQSFKLAVILAKLNILK